MRCTTTLAALLIGTLTSGCGLIIKGPPLIKAKVNEGEGPPEPKANPVEVAYVPSADEGQGTVIVNTTNVPAKVSLVTSMDRSAVNVEGQGAVTGGSLEGVRLQTKLLCSKTPCAFVLPLGSQTLHLEAPGKDGWDSSTDLYDFDVLPKARMLTHTMSRKRTTLKPTRGLVANILLETFGWTTLSLSPLGFIGDTPEVGIGLIVGGALMVAAGYVLYEPGESSTMYVPAASTVSDYPP